MKGIEITMSEDDFDNDNTENNLENDLEELNNMYKMTPLNSDDIKEEIISKPHEETTMRFPLTSCFDIPALKVSKDKDGEVIPLSANQLGEQLLERFPVAKTPNKTLYFYKNGVYVPNGRDAVEELIIQLLQHSNMMQVWNADYVGLVLKYIVTVAPTLWEKPVEDKINLLNGIFDITEWKLIPHTHKYLSTVQLPIEYDKDASCFGMEKFVREVFPKDAQHIAWEIMALLITSSNKDQNMIILSGTGSNGKSTFLLALENLLGKGNVSHVSLQRLESDRFAPSRLYQKLANICGDIPSTKLNSTLVFKSITGGDYVEIEFKNKNSFSTVLFSKLIFSANEIPKTTDTSEGFYRRIKIIPFDASFPESPTKLKELLAMVSEPEELSGMLNNALAALPSVLINGIRISDSMKNAHEEFREETDPMIDWINSNIEVRLGHWISKNDLYQMYKNDTEHTIVKSKRAFGTQIKKMLMPKVNDETRWIDNKIMKGWLNIAIKDIFVGR